ncbi:MAG TPA: glycosyltransferase [Acidiphilium sp.]
MRGILDHVGYDRIRGWAQDPADPDAPVTLHILANGIRIGRIAADLHRPDLERAGIGHGRHGFDFAIPYGLPAFGRHVIEVRSTRSEHLAGSPWTLDPVPDERDRQWRGHIDEVTRQHLRGWAQDAADPETPVLLRVFDNGIPLGRVLANTYRADLHGAGVGNGRQGFDWAVPGGLAPFTRHVIEIRCEADGALIGGGSVAVEPVDSFDATLEQVVSDAVAALNTEADRRHALGFLLAQTELVLQQQADTDGQRAGRVAWQQFRRRWGPRANRSDAPINPVEDPGLRALVIDGAVPAAGRDAGSQVILSHMRALRHLGYAVSFTAANEWEPADPSGALAAIGVTHCTAPVYASVEDVLRRQSACFDVVYLHREPVAARYLALTRHYMPRARIVYSVADLHHLRLERQAEIEQRPELRAMSRRLRLTECTAAWNADAVLTHSPAEAEFLRKAVPEADVHVAGWDVPVRRSKTPFVERGGLAFIGHYAHTPNLDAALWLVETVMPLVWQTDPEIVCHLVGSAMPDRLRQLAGPLIIAVGQVEDLGASVFDRVRLTVAPLRYGAGIKGKVLESFAAGIPCAMSDIAAEGFDLPPILRDLVGRDARALAAIIRRLHADEAANEAAGEAGLALVERDFSPAATQAALRKILKLPVSTDNPPTAAT